MNCNGDHKWDVGSPVIINKTIKIKTKCLICKENIIVEFGDNSFTAIDSTSDQEIKMINKRKINE